MKAFLGVLAILGVFTGCQTHKHIHKKEHHHYPEVDWSKKEFTIEQNIDLHLEEMPQETTEA